MRREGWAFRASAVAIAASFVAINADVAHRYGVKIGGDTIRYTSGAERLLAGDGLDHTQRIYSGYVALVAFAKEAGLGLEGVVVMQLVLAALACLALFSLGRRLGGRWVGLGAAALYATSLDFTRFTGWHAYLLTDSPYASMLAIAVWSMVMASERRGWSFAISGVLVVFAASLRLQGWLLIPAALIYWTVPLVSSRLQRIGVATGIAAAFSLLVLLSPDVSTRVADAGPGRALRDGVVIADSSAWRLSMPVERPSGSRGWGDVAFYAQRHPLASAEAGATRVAVEVACARITASDATR